MGGGVAGAARCRAAITVQDRSDTTGPRRAPATAVRGLYGDIFARLIAAMSRPAAPTGTAEMETKAAVAFSVRVWAASPAGSSAACAGPRMAIHTAAAERSLPLTSGRAADTAVVL